MGGGAGWLVLYSCGLHRQYITLATCEVSAYALMLSAPPTRCCPPLISMWPDFIAILCCFYLCPTCSGASP